LSDLSLQQRQREQKEQIDKMRGALEVALEANLKYRPITVSCGFFDSKLTSKVVMIPLNKDVIDATVAYEAALKNLNPSQKDKILQKSYRHFLSSKISTFVLMVINNESLDSEKNQIYFGDFRNTVYLLNEGQRQFKLKNYDTVLSAPLSPGLNIGYVTFDNFRGTQDGYTDTYAIHFASFVLTCNQRQAVEQKFAVGFDESEVKFVDLVAKGISVGDIRKNYVAEPYESVGLKANDVANLLVFVTKIL
jgi:hypothetical protein